MFQSIRTDDSGREDQQSPMLGVETIIPMFIYKEPFQGAISLHLPATHGVVEFRTEDILLRHKRFKGNKVLLSRGRPRFPRLHIVHYEPQVRSFSFILVLCHEKWSSRIIHWNQY